MRFCPESSFERDACTGCGTCSRVCPSQSIILDPRGFVAGFRKSCIHCGHCGAFCPAGAFGLPPAVPCPVPPEGLLALCKGRRSARTFRQGELSESELKLLLAPVGYAPTGTNSQGNAVVVIQGVSRIAGLVVEPVRRFLRPLLAPARLLGLDRYVRLMAEGGDPVTRRAPCMLLFFTPVRNTTPNHDGVIAAAMVSLQAEAMGLGCLWNGVVKMLFPLLPGLSRTRPRGTRLRAVLCVGRRELSPLHEVPERDWKTFIH